MKTQDKLIQSVATDLAHHDEVTLPDGRIVRFKEEPDWGTSIDDFVDCYGKVSHIGKWDDRPQRPDDFDGRARIVRSVHDRYWWQPPQDLADEYLNNTLRLVSEILEWGFYVYVVEVLELCGSCGRPEVTDTFAMGGMEPMMDMSNRIDVISDLLRELDL